MYKRQSEERTDRLIYRLLKYVLKVIKDKRLNEIRVQNQNSNQEEVLRLMELRNELDEADDRLGKSYTKTLAKIYEGLHHLGSINA